MTVADLAGADVLMNLGLQREFLCGGIQCCANAAELTRRVRHLMALTRLGGLPTLTCIDVHRPHDLGDDYVPPGFECDEPIEKMLACTILPNHTIVQPDNSLHMELDILVRAQQAIFTKVHRDPFTNPKIDRLMTEMPARRFVVFGVPLETSLRLLVLGLLRRNRRVVIVQDACGYFAEADASMVLRQLHVKGAELTTVDSYVREETARSQQRSARGRWRRRRSVA